MNAKFEDRTEALFRFFAASVSAVLLLAFVALVLGIVAVLLGHPIYPTDHPQD